MKKSNALILSSVIGVSYSLYVLQGISIIIECLNEDGIVSILFLIITIPFIVTLVLASIFSIIAVSTHKQWGAFLAMILYFLSGIPVLPISSYSIWSGIIGCLSLWGYLDLKKKSKVSDSNEKVIEENVIDEGVI